MTHLLPNGIVLQQHGDVIHPRRGAIGDEHLISITKFRAFGGQGAQHLGDAPGQGGNHLALEAGTATQGRDEHPVVVVDSRRLGDPTLHPHARVGTPDLG